MFNEGLITLILILTFVIKVLVDLIKQWTSSLNLPDNFHRYTSIVVALLLGLLLAYETGAGILQAFGLQVRHVWVDTIITGFFLAGGSDVVYEITNLVRDKRLNNAA